MFIKIKTVYLVFAISLFLCQSGICNELQEFFLNDTSTIFSCHDSSHEMSHEKNENSGSAFFSSFEQYANCCYESSLSAVNFTSKIFRLFELKYYHPYQLSNTFDFKLRRIINRGHPHPEIFSINSSYLI